MTDPKGKSFLSYTRTQSKAAQLLIGAQHDHGIPTWQDISDLELGPTEEALREVLNSKGIANAVLLISDDIRDSKMILDVEAPLILKRGREDERFFVLPVTIGGVSYDDAARLLKSKVSVENLSAWDIYRITAQKMTYKHAAEVARRILRRRLTLIHEIYPSESNISIFVTTRHTKHSAGGPALSLDWSRHYQGRTIRAGTWDKYMRPALEEITAQIGQCAPNRRIVGSGFCSIPVAFAMGAGFLAPKGIPLTWKQPSSDGSEQLWSLDAERTVSGFHAQELAQESGHDALAVLINVTSDTEAAFSSSRNVNEFRAVLSISADGSFPHEIPSPGEAKDLAYTVRDAIKGAQDKYRKIRSVHLFAACPIGLCVLIGQLTNVLGPVHTYEFIATDSIGHYEPALVLNPSLA